MDELSKNRIGLIRSILVLTICIISCTIFLANHKAQLKLEAQNKNTTPQAEMLDITDVNAIDVETSNRQILSLDSINDMFREVSVTFTDIDNLKTMSISTVKVLGHLLDNETEKLGIISGNYTCLDQTNKCLYSFDTTASTNGSYNFKMYVVFDTNDNDEYYISSLNESSLKDDINFIKDEYTIE